MISHSMNNLARRGAEALVRETSEGDKETVIKLSPLAAIIFVLTILLFFVSMFAITYTYGEIIPTLCMIESPETNAYVPVETIASADEPPAYSEDDDDGLPKPAEPEVLLVRNKPYTTSIRETILHLRARAGYWSRFRGMGIYLAWTFMRNVLISLVSGFSRNPALISVAAIIAEVALAHLHMTWVHIVISEPSERKWYQRIPSLRGNWIKIAPAVLLFSVVTQIVHVLPMLACGSWGALKHMRDPNFEPGNKHIYISATQLFMAMLLTVALFITLQIPAAVTFVRVSASMLPEEDETIVPFDRSFGGKVTPMIVGGQGKIGLIEAWRSFPWQSRKRLLMLCVKVATIIVSLWILFSIVVVFEAHAFLGPGGLKTIMKSMHRSSN